MGLNLWYQFIGCSVCQNSQINSLVFNGRYVTIESVDVVSSDILSRNGKSATMQGQS
jgi:hypothetical protein